MRSLLRTTLLCLGLAPLALAGLACDSGGGTTDTDTGSDTTDPSGTETDPSAGGDGTFSGDIYPNIIEMNCSCHLSATGSGGLAMPDAATAYANLVGVESTGAPGETLVAAGDSAASYLVAKLRGTQSAGVQMPQGLDPLPETEISAVEAWIDGGAVE